MSHLLSNTTVMQHPHGIPVRPYTHKELAHLYHVSWVTFQRWLRPHQDEIGPKHGHFYTQKQVQIIFEKIGWPG